MAETCRSRAGPVLRPFPQSRRDMKVFQADLKGEIAKALRMKDTFGRACLADPESVRLLNDLRDRIRMTEEAMARYGVVSKCAKCAAERGSCCFMEMGESYGALELFINLLLGSDIPEEPEFPGNCHFVGSAGCVLPSRQAFCLNYFCPELEKSLGGETIHLIRRRVGAQLLVARDLELALARCIRSAHGSDRPGVFSI